MDNNLVVRLLSSGIYESVWLSETGECFGVGYSEDGINSGIHYCTLYSSVGTSLGKTMIYADREVGEIVSGVTMWLIGDARLIDVSVTTLGEAWHCRFLGSEKYEAIFVDDLGYVGVRIRSEGNNVMKLKVDEYKDGEKIRVWEGLQEIDRGRFNSNVYNVFIGEDRGHIRWGVDWARSYQTQVRQTFGDKSSRIMSFNEYQEIKKRIGKKYKFEKVHKV